MLTLTKSKSLTLWLSIPIILGSIASNVAFAIPEDANFSTFTDIAMTSRSQDAGTRDKYRNPNETLAFFEIKPQQTVVEIWPGGGWYTEILAPYLKDEGIYYAAHFNQASEVGFFQKMRAKFNNKIKQSPDQYSKVITTDFEPPKLTSIAPNNSADRVLTFRNVHNWMKNGAEQSAFNAFFTALKSNGILGVVEHRATEDFNLNEMIVSGYVTESYVKLLAEKAGFEFLGASEVNANPLDSKNHPKGVWTLPPSLRLGDTEKDNYLKIGESDRMTLKFRKP
ncbi:MAG: putative methyltransferase [Bermanella sp.]|jgi:predicted methyltransferase